MSSVLKALKKLEEEKRDGVAPAPSCQRWASGGQPQPCRRPWLLAGSGLAIGLLLLLVLLWSTRKPDGVATAPPLPERPAPSPSIPAPPTKAQEPGGPVAAKASPVQPAAISSLPSAASQPQSLSRPVAHDPVSSAVPVVANPSAVTKPVTPLASRSAPEVAADIAVTQVKVNRFDIPSPGQEWVAPPQLVVTEIFPPAGGERMAIVNGLPVMAGTMVEEALVEEIHDDRVLFAIGGKRVTVPLQKNR